MELTKCTKEEGILILNAAGYAVKETDKTFSIWDGAVKIFGCSTKEWLENPMFIQSQFVQKRSFANGFEAGKRHLQKQLRNLLEVTQ